VPFRPAAEGTHEGGHLRQMHFGRDEALLHGQRANPKWGKWYHCAKWLLRAARGFVSRAFCWLGAEGTGTGRV
jgi:hypothetical protein